MLAATLMVEDRQRRRGREKDARYSLCVPSGLARLSGSAEVASTGPRNFLGTGGTWHTDGKLDPGPGILVTNSPLFMRQAAVLLASGALK